MLQLPWLTYPTETSGLKTHCPFLAVQGYVTSDSIPPACLMYSKAWEGRPPLHPWLSKSPAQSTSCCSAKVISLPFPRMFQCDSMDPIVENAQHDPHDPWFLTAVTTLRLFHSQVAGTAESLYSSLILSELVAEQSWGVMSLVYSNSCSVMSVKSLMPLVHECLPILWFLMEMRVQMKILNLQSDLVVYGEWYALQIFLAVSSEKTPSPLRKSLCLMLRWMLQSATARSTAISRSFDIRYEYN